MKPVLSLVRRIAVPAGLAAIAALSMVFVFDTRIAAQAPAYVLDHFKCYYTTNQPPNVRVGLKDQFDTALQDTLVWYAVRFCNPVEKTRRNGVVTLIQDPLAHLKMYLIAHQALAPTRIVTYSNQFGQRRLKTYQPEVLAVPTGKNGAPQSPDLDHFKCYRATGLKINAAVVLRDQFHTETVKVLDPFGFCNPSEKVHGTLPKVDIKHPQDHLVCYKITQVPFATTVTTNNQFGSEILNVRDADLLCVPSKKLAVSVP